MSGNIYTPLHQLPFETEAEQESVRKQIEEMNVSDEQMVAFIKSYFDSFRSIVDEFFPQLAGVLTYYAHQPFHTTIVRFGPNGVFISHKRSDVEVIEVKWIKDFDPPLKTPLNIFDIAERLGTESSWFSGVAAKYDEEEAHRKAISDALAAVMQFFWHSFPSEEVFQDICTKLIKAEGVHVESSQVADIGSSSLRVDLLAKVVLKEPAGYKRLETWGFEFRYYSEARVSAALLHEIEEAISSTTDFDVLCLVTPDDLTSISRYLAVDNPRIRVWDREILYRLVNSHLEVLRDYFAEYPKAVEELLARVSSKRAGDDSQLDAFDQRLRDCMPGNTDFAKYQDTGIEILNYLFSEHLGEPKPQSGTQDGKQRRDVLFRNKRSSPFFDRVFHRHGANSIIVDFKNYTNEVAADVVPEVEKYANKALGHFILVVSRKGADATVEAAQLRAYRDSDTIVLIVSDEDLLEMIRRKENGQNPEDVLEDKLDELLARY